jgi:hypothetical protein
VSRSNREVIMGMIRAFILQSALVIAVVGCREHLDPCMTGSYQVELGDLVPLSGLSYPEDGTLDRLGEGWVFGIEPAPYGREEHISACYPAGARYAPTPEGAPIVSQIPGNPLGNHEYRAAVVLVETIAVEYQECLGGVQTVLLTPHGSDKVEDAMAKGVPVAAQLCFFLDEEIGDPETPACRSLGIGRGCVVREATLSPLSEAP